MKIVFLSGFLYTLFIANAYGFSQFRSQSALKSFSKKYARESRLRKPESLELGKKYTQWFEQPLDHFNPQNEQTWKQRYFVNDEYYSKDSGTVFLCVGGEGPALTAAVVTEDNIHCSLMVKLAKEKKGLIVAVEHRFYGKSIPTNDFTTESLQFLSSQQALADLARVHQHVSKEYAIPGKTKWIAFGGSYPGVMASFFRIKYPHLVWAAVASSAPVEAIANMQGYNNVVAESLAAPEVGGSPECRDSVRQSFVELGEHLGSFHGRRELETLFRICAPLSLDDGKNQLVFTESLMSLFPLQSNDPSCTESLCNYEKICKLFTKEGMKPFEALTVLAENDFIDGSCMHVSFAKELANLKDTSLSSGSDRSWIYQTCTEFGFYQTCDPETECVFCSKPHLNTLDSYYYLCRKAFGISGDVTEERIRYSNLYYGGNRTDATRIFYVNGQVDPWRSQSVQTSSNPELPALMVPGASVGFLFRNGQHPLLTHL